MLNLHLRIDRSQVDRFGATRNEISVAPERLTLVMAAYQDSSPSVCAYVARDLVVLELLHAIVDLAILTPFPDVEQSGTPRLLFTVSQALAPPYMTILVWVRTMTALGFKGEILYYSIILPKEDNMRVSCSDVCVSGGNDLVLRVDMDAVLLGSSPSYDNVYMYMYNKQAAAPLALY